MRTNGRPRPIENEKSRSALLAGSDCVVASARVPASTGPMQGVHPAANAIPSGNAAAPPGRTLARSGRRSPYSEADPTRKGYSSRNTPTTRTTSPATRSPVVDRTIGTNTPANAPRDVKTTEKPATNRSTGRALGRTRSGGDFADPEPSP